MKRGFRHSVGCKLAAGFSSALLLCAFLLKEAAAARNATRLGADREIERAAVGRLDDLVGCDERTLAEMRAKAARFRIELGGAGTFEAAIKCLGKRWVRQSSENLDRGGFSTRTDRFAMISPTPSDWPGIVASINALEKLPGAGVREINLKASESVLDQVSIVLAVETPGRAVTEISR